jgi:hypothetical protein
VVAVVALELPLAARQLGFELGDPAVALLELAVEPALVVGLVLLAELEALLELLHLLAPLVQLRLAPGDLVCAFGELVALACELRLVLLVGGCKRVALLCELRLALLVDGCELVHLGTPPGELVDEAVVDLEYRARRPGCFLGLLGRLLRLRGRRSRSCLSRGLPRRRLAVELRAQPGPETLLGLFDRRGLGSSRLAHARLPCIAHERDRRLVAPTYPSAECVAWSYGTISVAVRKIWLPFLSLMTKLAVYAVFFGGFFSLTAKLA